MFLFFFLRTRMPTPTFPSTDQVVISPTGTMSLDRSVVRSMGSQMKNKDTDKTRYGAK